MSSEERADVQPGAQPLEEIMVTRRSLRPIKVAVIGIFAVHLLGVMYFASSFVLPVLLALLFALILSPTVRFLRRRGLPEPVSAVILVVTLTATLAAGAYMLSGPVTAWIQDAPQMMQQVRTKLYELRRPMEKVKEATEQVNQLANAKDPTVQEVVVKEPGLLSKVASDAPELLGGFGLMMVLLLFLLASGDLFHEKLIKALPTFSDKRRALRIARDVEREVSGYLFTITLINAGLGVAVGLAMYAVGMPNPVLWGVVAAIVNYVPYLGAMVGIVVVFLVALVSLDTLGHALLAPALYFACTSLEGQLITPALVGRRLRVNSVAVFFAIAFWGWLWGVAGILMAVPILIVIKVLAEHIEGLHGVAEFLGPREDRSAPAAAAAEAEASSAVTPGGAKG